MPANIQELQCAFSKTPQSTIDAASSDLVRFNTTSDDLADVEFVIEDDAKEIGKGHEFPENTFPTAWKVTKKVQCYLTAESFGIFGSFALGTGDAGTYSPIDPLTNVNEIELPHMTVLEAIRKGGTNPILNRALLACVVDKFKIMLAKGAGRANAKLEADLIGSGKHDDASSLTMPDKTPVHLLPAASLTCVINGTDYTAGKTFESFDFQWDNNVRDGFFPGSGFQIDGDPTSGQVQGRMEYGDRAMTSSYVARYQANSTELVKLNAQTQGTVAIGLSGGAGFNGGITCGQVRFKHSKVDNSSGIVTVRTDMSALYDQTTGFAGLVTLTATNSLGAVGRA
jgi:hypothetical protein